MRYASSTTEVTSFYINSNGSKVIYINEDGDIYQKENKKGKEKLDSNASIVYVSEDLSSIYYLKNNALYLKNVGKDKEKLFSDVSSVIHVYDSGEIYYVKSADITYNLSDFVNDDMAATDALIVEPMMPLYPSYDDYLPDMSYPTEPDPSWYTDIWGYYDWDLYDQYYNDYYAQRDEYNAQWQANYDEAVRQYNEAYDEYLAEYDQYFAKQDRDYLRQSIQGVTIPVTNYGLYYYNKKDSILVSDTYADFLSYSYETPLVLFRSNNKAEITKVNLSEVYSFDTLYSSANDSVYSSGEVNAAIKEVMAGVPQEEGGSYIVKPNGELLYYLDNYDSEENSYDLYEVKISNGKMDIPTKIDSGVYSISLAYNSYALVYYKNVKNGAGDLYIDKKPVDSDVYSYSVGAIQDTDEFLYFVDYDEDSYAGTLKIYDGKTSKKVGDDIYSYDVINKDSILYLTDYNIDKARGDLYLYNGTDKKKQIDTDVTSLLTIYMNNSRGYLSSFWY